MSSIVNPTITAVPTVAALPPLRHNKVGNGDADDDVDDDTGPHHAPKKNSSTSTTTTTNISSPLSCTRGSTLSVQEKLKLSSFFQACTSRCNNTHDPAIRKVKTSPETEEAKPVSSSASSSQSKSLLSKSSLQHGGTVSVTSKARSTDGNHSGVTNDCFSKEKWKQLIQRYECQSPINREGWWWLQPTNNSSNNNDVVCTDKWKNSIWRQKQISLAVLPTTSTTTTRVPRTLYWFRRRQSSMTEGSSSSLSSIVDQDESSPWGHHPLLRLCHLMEEKGSPTKRSITDRVPLQSFSVPTTIEFNDDDDDDDDDDNDGDNESDSNNETVASLNNQTGQVTLTTRTLRQEDKPPSKRTRLSWCVHEVFIPILLAILLYKYLYRLTEVQDERSTEFFRDDHGLDVTPPKRAPKRQSHLAKSTRQVSERTDDTLQEIQVDTVYSISTPNTWPKSNELRDQAAFPQLIWPTPTEIMEQMNKLSPDTEFQISMPDVFLSIDRPIHEECQPISPLERPTEKHPRRQPWFWNALLVVDEYPWDRK